jgi:hypothetical protein
MFQLLFYALLGVTALFIYSWLSLFFLPAGARDARPSYKRKTGGVTLIFCVVSGLVYYLQKNDNMLAASLTLYCFYGVIGAVILWAIYTARWN